MTLDQMAIEVLEAWKASATDDVRLWDKQELWENALAVAEMAKAEAAGSGFSDRTGLAVLLGLYPTPGSPGSMEEDGADDD